MLHWMLWSPQCLQVPIAGICPSCRSPEPTSHGNGWVAHGFTNLGGTNMYKLTDFLKGQHVDTTLYPQTHTGLKISKQKCQKQSPTLSNLDQVVTFPLLCRAAKASEQETTCRTSLEYGWKLFKSGWLQAKYCMSCGEAWMALQNITWHLEKRPIGAPFNFPIASCARRPWTFADPQLLGQSTLRPNWKHLPGIIIGPGPSPQMITSPEPERNGRVKSCQLDPVSKRYSI